MTDLVTLTAALASGEDIGMVHELPPTRCRARRGRIARADVRIALEHGALTNGCKDIAEAHRAARVRAGRGE